MSNDTQTRTTVTSIGVVMFGVADQDVARDFYTGTLGWEVRGDSTFGPDGEYRWLEVAPPGSVARVALNLPMDEAPGGSAIGVETADLAAEHARLSAIGGVGMDALPDQDMPGVPRLFMLRDPDGNTIVVVETP